MASSNIKNKKKMSHQKYADRVASLTASLLYKKKTSGTEVRRTLDVRLRFVGFNFSHVQLLMFVVIVILSYSFYHLVSVMKVFLFKIPK